MNNRTSANTSVTASARTIDRRPLQWLMLATLLVVAMTIGSGAALAQRAEAPRQDYTAEELQELVGPIALYPDELVSIVLPASTYPLQIVQAARFLDDLEADPSLKPSEDWDETVVALLNYPEVLRMMNEDLDWTWALGDAVLGQQGDVIDAIQDFRDRAYVAGNLRSDAKQTVARGGDVIEIRSADPKVVYIPYYDPVRVVVYQRIPVYYYYPHAYPLYYYPYAAGHRFAVRFFWGISTAFSIGWHTHYLHVHHHTHIGHPYYSHYYYAPYYAYDAAYLRPSVHIDVNLGGIRHVWQPSHRRASRPHRHYAARDWHGYRQAPSREHDHGGYRDDHGDRTHDGYRDRDDRDRDYRGGGQARPQSERPATAARLRSQLEHGTATHRREARRASEAGAGSIRRALGSGQANAGSAGRSQQPARTPRSAPIRRSEPATGTAGASRPTFAPSRPPARIPDRAAPTQRSAAATPRPAAPAARPAQAGNRGHATSSAFAPSSRGNAGGRAAQPRRQAPPQADNRSASNRLR